MLVYVEQYDDFARAISRGKPSRGRKRNRKLDLIAPHNLKWLDLAANWFPP